MGDSTVDVSGPVFDGRAEAAAHAAAEGIRHALGERGEQLVTGAFTGSIRDNHGVFLSTITMIDRSRVYEWGGDEGHRTYTMPVTVGHAETVVTTELATYGPWLEGTGSRNQTTRFKGYHGFRRAAQALELEAGAVADVELRTGGYVEAMNA